MDPITMAALASAGIGAIGELLGGINGFGRSRAEARALRARAAQARVEGGVNAGLALEEGERAAARAATLAASGGGGLTGSALDVLDDMGRQTVYNARVATYEAETEARNSQYEAKVAKTQGNVELLTGVLKAGATAAGGFAQASAARRTAAASRIGRSGGAGMRASMTMNRAGSAGFLSR